MFLESSLVGEKVKLRSQGLAKVRAFFQKRTVFEVDTPTLNPYSNIDAHIEPVELKNGYLRTSPEFALKKLLAQGAPDIYEIGHVFRKEEKGKRHHPEFTLIEWYRLGFTLEQMIEETLDLIHLFIKRSKVHRWTYQQLFQVFLDIDPIEATVHQLKKKLPSSAPPLSGKDELLDFLLIHWLEPQLQTDVHVIKNYPKSQCALAKITGDIAQRFEVYVNGLEIANGYDELCSSQEQKERFERENSLRLQQNKELLPIDDEFIRSLDNLPSCCGVAVGFDRLLMLAHHIDAIQDIVF